MALKYTVDSLDGVDEAHRGLYVEQNGKFVLGVDGAVSAEKLNEFRTNNVALLKERDDLVRKFDGIDPDQYREFAEAARKVREKQLVESGKVEELIEERIKPMRTTHERQLAAIAKERDDTKRQLSALVIDSALQEAAIKHNIIPSAVEDVLHRGRATFRLVDGKAVAMKDNVPLLGGTGQPLSVSEWVASLQEVAPHMFPASTGGGARGNTGVGQSRVGTVAASDTRGFITNLDKIARGEMGIV